MSFWKMGMKLCSQLLEDTTGSPQGFMLGHLPHLSVQEKGFVHYLELRSLQY